MSKPRIIYARPGDMIEIRMVCHDDFDLNARSWRDQTYPTSMLIMAVDSNEIAFATTMTRVVRWPSRPSGGDRHGE
ncbi:hypothetical protein [Brucella anthropi]|uniref:hypothetical protein n=1 Tax=Brucella anthropi TaxID=529 RepID=UPI000CFBC00C|nr:hypothetical protein [Ochrobactrum sp. MYb49]PQZ63072.1 hypothetical protein CQ057_16770 [Ochrobactrum sp. MYb49]